LDPLPAREEIANYSASKKLALAKQRDPARWWKQHEEIFPVLSAVILKIYSVVPSTAGAERVHALTKRLISSQQTRMDPDMINMLRFIKTNLPFFYPALSEDIEEDIDDD